MKSLKLLPVLLVLVCSMAADGMSQDSVETKLQDASKAYSSGKYAESIKLMEDALEETRPKAPLNIENFHPVKTEAAYFGAFEPRSNVYSGGETLYFYMEPKNIVFLKKGEIYTGGFAIDIKVKNDKNEVLFEQPKFLDAAFSSKSLINDIFANITLSLTGVPPGKYNVEFNLKDQNSDKSAGVQQEIIVN